MLRNAWICDDAATGNRDTWYLIDGDGNMVSAELVQDGTGNFYSLETEHNGFYGMLRYVDGWYNCNGQQVYLQFSHRHDGTFGAVINPDGLARLKAIYPVTPFGIGNQQCVYTASF